MIDLQMPGLVHKKYGDSSISAITQKRQLVILNRNKQKINYKWPIQDIAVKDVKQYSNSEALIAFIYLSNKSEFYSEHSVIIYSLIKREIIKQCRLQNKISCIKQLNGQFVSIYESFSIAKYIFGFEKCFSTTKQTSFKNGQFIGQCSDKTTFFQDPSCVQLVVQQVNNNKTLLSKVQLKKANKINRYIHLLQELGWIKDFESDIVKAVLTAYTDQYTNMPNLRNASQLFRIFKKITSTFKDCFLNYSSRQLGLFKLIRYLKIVSNSITNISTFGLDKSKCTIFVRGSQQKENLIIIKLLVKIIFIQQTSGTLKVKNDQTLQILF